MQSNENGSKTLAPGETVPRPGTPQAAPAQPPDQVQPEEDIITPLLQLTNPETGDVDVPPISIRSAMLMEKIDSPYLRDPLPKVNPVTGEPVLDENGKLIMVPVAPSIQEVAETFFVLLKQDRPDILSIIRDPLKFEEITLQFAAALDPITIAKVGRKINENVARLNSAAVQLGGGGKGAKKETGDTPPSERCSPDSAETPTQ